MKDNKLEKAVKIILVIIAIACTILFLLLCENVIKVKAAVITGDTPIAGFSKLMQDVIDKKGEIIDHEDLELLSEVMFWENYSNGYEVMLYTGSVVLNRVKHPDFPDTIREVLYQSGQYITTPEFFTKEIPQEVKNIALHLLLCGSQAPARVIFQSTHREFGSGVWKCIKGEYFNYE